MSHWDYTNSLKLMIDDPSFASLIMAAIRKADSYNTEKIKIVFPEIYWEFKSRYNAPGGLLEDERKSMYEEIEDDELRRTTKIE